MFLEGIAISVHLCSFFHILWSCSAAVSVSFHIFRGEVLFAFSAFTGELVSSAFDTFRDDVIIILPYDRSFDICHTEMGHSGMWMARIKSLTLLELCSAVLIKTHRGKNNKFLCCRFSLYIVLLCCLAWVAVHSKCLTFLSTISAVTAGVVLWRGPSVSYSLLYDWHNMKWIRIPFDYKDNCCFTNVFVRFVVSRRIR